MEIEVSQVVKDFPSYMEAGSQGPAVNLILAFLIGWAGRLQFEDHGVICDAEYGDRGTNLMKSFQDYYRLEADGGCGPQTRECMKQRFGFDFESAARSTGGPTVFVQPNGNRFLWTAN